MKSFLRLRLLRNLKVRPRLLISLAIAGFVYVLLPSWLRLPARAIITWNAGAICFLGLAGFMISSATPQSMRRRAQLQDEGRLVILTLVVAAACASLLAIVFILKDTKALSPAILTLHVALAGITVIFSWLLMHTMFALHYAHDYYRRDRTPSSSETQAEALEFPGENQPDYWDFLYFSFVIGMTCQVSDVQVRSRAMRRLTLVHGVVTFFFNTVILALSINILAGLI